MKKNILFGIIMLGFSMQNAQAGWGDLVKSFFNSKKKKVAVGVLLSGIALGGITYFLLLRDSDSHDGKSKNYGKRKNLNTLEVVVPDVSSKGGSSKRDSGTGVSSDVNNVVKPDIVSDNKSINKDTIINNIDETPGDLSN